MLAFAQHEVLSPKYTIISWKCVYVTLDVLLREDLRMPDHLLPWLNGL